MIVLAILFPWLYFFVKGKTIPGIICFVLYLTIIGWILAAIWAINTFIVERQQNRNERIVREVLGSTAMNIYS